MGPPQYFRIVLQDLAVIGKKSVDLNLDIGRLRVDRAAEALLRQLA